MKAALLKQKIEAAEKQLETAEQELASALARLKVTGGGDNVMVTNVVAKAFGRLTAARTKVGELKAMLDISEG